MPRELTPREFQVIWSIADGHTMQETAELLGIKFYTVKTHMGRILFKLDARTQAHAIAMLCRQGRL